MFITNLQRKQISLKKRFYQYWTNVLLNKNMAEAVLITKNYGLCVMLYLYDWHFNFDRSFSNQEGKNIQFDHKCVNDPLMINKTLAFLCVIGPNVLRKSNNCDKNIVFLVQKKKYDQLSNPYSWYFFSYARPWVCQ